MQAVHLYPPSFSVYSLFSHVWKDAHIPIIMQVTRIKGSADKAEWEAQFILNLKVSSLVREQKKNSALVVQIVLEDPWVLFIMKALMLIWQLPIINTMFRS